MNALSYKTRMSRLTFVFCVIAHCYVETDIYKLYKYAFLATVNSIIQRTACCRFRTCGSVMKLSTKLLEKSTTDDIKGEI